MADAAPNFIYVGAPKSGSTWLFRALQEHPEVFVLPAKSSGYFETETPGPLTSYLEKFANARAAKAIGEVAHNTYVTPSAAARIAAVFPDMKILLCLREPGDFAASVLKWWTTHETTFGKTVPEMEKNPHFLRLTDYVGSIRPFYDHFPGQRICVTFLEDLRLDPAAYLDGIHGFLGVNRAHRPAILDTVVNNARRPRFRPLTHFIYASGGVLRGLGLGNFVEKCKALPVMDTLLYAPGEAPESPEIAEAAARVRERARGDLAALEALIGRPLPGEWYER